MNTFTASNGMTVERDHNDDVLINRGTESMSLFMADGTALALREFFRAEEDERLGRWRSKGHPEYMVTRKTRDELVIAHEDGRWWYYNRGADQPTTADLAAVAREFFDAHPEPKPWQDAKPGEVWDVDLILGGIRAVTVTTGRPGERITVFRDAHTRIEVPLDDGDIRDARRVWPEVAS